MHDTEVVCGLFNDTFSNSHRIWVALDDHDGEQWIDKNVEGRSRDPVLKYYTGGTRKSQKYLSDDSQGLNRWLPKPELLPPSQVCRFESIIFGRVRIRLVVSAFSYSRKSAS